MKRVFMMLLTSAILSVLIVPALANTDGTETPIEETAMFTIQLGPGWAGVEFELKTDDGLYPAPVVVDHRGILTMELNGSKNYILSCIMSPVTPPSPEPTPDSVETQEAESGAEQSKQEGIPTIHLVVFIGGLLICTVALVFMRLKRRRMSYDDYDDEDDDY